MLVPVVLNVPFVPPLCKTGMRREATGGRGKTFRTFIPSRRFQVHSSRFNGIKTGLVVPDVQSLSFDFASRRAGQALRSKRRIHLQTGKVRFRPNSEDGVQINGRVRGYDTRAAQEGGLSTSAISKSLARS